MTSKLVLVSKKNDFFGYYFEAFLFFAAILITIFTTYFLPSVLSTIWSIVLLVLYYRSKNESFWLAFFLVLSDGFIGFFGLYETTLQLLPGLPAIELVQFYILISFVKTAKKGRTYSIFYSNVLFILFLYLLFLFFWGFINGLPNELNEILRILKLTLPFLLFFTIPKLFESESSFQKIFVFLFPVAVLAFIAHLFTLVFGSSPAEYIGVRQLSYYSIDYAEKGQLARIYYSPNILWISFFSALFYLRKGSSYFNKGYLILIIVLIYTMAFLSATRGLVISMSTILILYFLFASKVSIHKVILFLPIAFFFIFLGLKQPVIRSQIYGAWDRLFTVVEMVEGDEEALATEQRTTVRGPRVMNKWRENPLFGWGFSKTTFEYSDGHVGNQSLLLQSGIVGFVLLYFFILYFILKLWRFSLFVNNKNIRNYIAVIPIFFIGWIILHSTSGQQFSFMGSPGKIIVQAIIFSFGALQYIQMHLWRQQQQ